MAEIDHTHDASATSWIASANKPDCDFPIQNLPFAVFRRSGTSEPFRGGVAIGDQIVDLAALSRLQRLAGLAQSAVESCARPALNDFFALGGAAWKALRIGLFGLLAQSQAESEPESVAVLQKCLVPQSAAEYELPVRIGDYTDFYTSIYHARTISKLFNPNADVSHNFHWLPTCYHGRVSTIGVSGQEFHRPCGQTLQSGDQTPALRPCARLDYELELGIFVGKGNRQGEPIGIADAEGHVFGICLLNDWSARDIQAWESVPLGPFHAKNFATTVSPWIVTMDALAPYRKPWTRQPDEPQPLPYLDSERVRSQGAFDIQLEVALESDAMRREGQGPVRLSRTSFAHQYWTVAQMVTHHAVGGCSFQPGDLLGSGTISGPDIEEAGAMMELTLAGKKPVRLPNGETRSFIEDGDAIFFRGWCERSGYKRIGFGTSYGRVLPAREIA
jgi:fumarylacetoacetase